MSKKHVADRVFEVFERIFDCTIDLFSRILGGLFGAVHIAHRDL